MILRVPDYYKDFKCIAGDCSDSCCAGWEIDIDQDSAEYYCQVEGEFGDRLREKLQTLEDGEHCFKLTPNGRCPFLNDDNLCDIIINLGEEAISEVCTEYPRFCIEYSNAVHKFYSLSCEEVGRIVFNLERKVGFVDIEMPDACCYEENENVQMDEEEIQFAYNTMLESIKILQNREITIGDRIRQYLDYVEEAHNKLNHIAGLSIQEAAINEDEIATASERFYPFTQMVVINEEWNGVRKGLESYSDEELSELVKVFMQSSDYKELDYEQLMVYFTFRYLMNCVYDKDLKSYAKLSVLFTLVIRDMDAVRFKENGGHFERKDRVDTARIFSKEVEHSEENNDLVLEEIPFMLPLVW